MIEVQNLTKTKINKTELRKIAERVLRKEKGKGKDLSLVLVGPQRMRKLSKIYRGKDVLANVLSFQGEGFLLGEVVLCPSVIRKDALEYKIPFQGALCWMLVHGLLHLLGYSHETLKQETIMTKKEQQYLSTAS
ncbi:MAG: rRNA maturation RNase YbeY [Candidatus Wildermuthbacteria bacterium RIFCSPHIGHO2_01_FULL_49_22b]|uniref:Endoribonuclease YbeY n=1 Tax=Candidatus Wildermuthbacteria bacterium RIFCSPHIGHO2_01_FULL_49_22b TaxID=1802448 RepID=A0A1G2QW24_9BACT|nr:MAG: rRNA maturation RNase YbeY [Candidatus Wildermuthbacteria bacterium RIFCSPHIGHO2_01_FULL_49_22b]